MSEFIDVIIFNSKAGKELLKEALSACSAAYYRVHRTLRRLISACRPQWLNNWDDEEIPCPFTWGELSVHCGSTPSKQVGCSMLKRMLRIAVKNGGRLPPEKIRRHTTCHP